MLFRSAALAVLLTGCSDGGYRVGTPAADAAPPPPPADAPVVQPDGPVPPADLVATAAPDVGWAAVGRVALGPLLAQIAAEPRVFEVAAGREPTGLAQPVQAACYRVSRDDEPGRPGIAIDFGERTRPDCVITGGVVRLRAPLVGQTAVRAVLSVPATIAGRRVEGALRLTPAGDDELDVATADPETDPPLPFQGSCAGERIQPCVRVCDAGGVCIVVGLTGRVRGPTESAVVTLQATGLAQGLTGVLVTNHVNERLDLGGPMTAATLPCEDEPSTDVSAPLAYSVGEGAGCLCPSAGTAAAVGDVEAEVSIGCAQDTRLRFVLVAREGRTRLTWTGCETVATVAFCGDGAVLEVPDQQARGCAYECRLLGCTYEPDTSVCACASQSIPREPRHALLGLEEALKPRLAEAVRAACAPSAGAGKHLPGP